MTRIAIYNSATAAKISKRRNNPGRAPPKQRGLCTVGREDGDVDRAEQVGDSAHHVESNAVGATSSGTS